MSSTKAADVAIVGGAGIGSAIAYFLASTAKLGTRIVVYEKDPSYEKSATALSAGGIRQQFSTPENIRMSQYGFEFLKSAKQELAVGDFQPDMSLKEWGYLTMVAAAGRDGLRKSYEFQKSMGAGTEWLEPDEIARRWPWMNCDDVAAGALGNGGEGTFDPFALLQGFRRKAISLGVEYRHAEVTGIDLDGTGQVKAVRLADGRVEACGTLINAAGPLAARVAAMVGVDIPVIALKAHTFAFKTDAHLPDCPIVMAPYDLLFRPEGHLYICTQPTEMEMKDANGDFEVDYAPFEASIWPALAQRVPQFDSVKMTSAWVGHVEYNVFDSNPIIGRHPQIRNFVFANGFSGHGIQHAPAAGRGIAELLTEGAYRSIDLSRFCFERIAAGEPVREIAA